MEPVTRFSDKPPGKSNENFVARLSPVPAVSHTTLWQEHPTVRESGLLDQLTVDQIKYQEVRRTNTLNYYLQVIVLLCKSDTHVFHRVLTLSMF